MVAASGMGIISAVLWTLLEKDAHIVASEVCYTGTQKLLGVYFPKFGVDVSLVDTTDLDEVKAAIETALRSIGRYEKLSAMKARPELDAADREILDRLLRYGPRETVRDADGWLLLVVPRLGTISPWSSKATEIARICGLERIRRLERGIAYRVSGAEEGAFAEIAPLLHDRMTETVLKRPVIVYDYPKKIKAFYMRVNDGGETVAAMDVLVPKVGEIIGGSQRAP